MKPFTSEQIQYKPLYFPWNWKYEKNTTQDLFYAFAKRGIDIVLSLFFIVVFFPLYLTIFFAILISTKEFPVIKHKRIGLNGKAFNLYKFKSMSGPVKYEYSPINEKDQRITKIRSFLRKSSLDEIPQFFNVLKGEMSIVGPRPEMEFIVKKYNSIEKNRLKVKPGITGLWQIKADRKKLIHENIDFDLDYIKNKSLYLDFSIMAQTVMFMLKCINK